MITDRNGQILAISLPTVAVFADPRQIIDPAEAAHRLKQVLPRLDEAAARDAAVAIRTGSSSTWNARSRRASNWRSTRSGIPGIDFRPTEQRHYPMGRTAAQVLGGVDVDEHGVAGVEKYFDQRLFSDNSPLRLSIDVRVQAVVRDELSKAIDFFQAIGGCGIVMDVNTGEVLAMVSLPDYDANDFRTAPADDRFNRAVTGMYEPGSTFKLQTASMALDSGIVHIWDQFDAAHDIHIGRFTITRLRGQAPLALSAGSAGLLLQSRRRAHRRHRRRRAPARLAQVDGHVRPRRHRAARGGAADRPAGRGLEGGRDADRGVRPRHLGLAAACGARHRGGCHRRAACARPSWRCRRASSRRACR